MASAAPTPSRQNHRNRLNAFMGTLEGASWEYAGRAVATFISNALPDSVAVLFQLSIRPRIH